MAYEVRCGVVTQSVKPKTNLHDHKGAMKLPVNSLDPNDMTNKLRTAMTHPLLRGLGTRHSRKTLGRMDQVRNARRFTARAR